MFFDAAKEIEHALDIVRNAEVVTFSEVEACLRAARTVAVTVGCSHQVFDAAAGRIIDALLDGALLARGGGAVAQHVAPVLRALPGVAEALARGSMRSAPPVAHHWSVCPPVKEGLFSIAPGQQFRRAAQGNLHRYSSDHHHPALDPAAIRRMMRSLGRDFGPDSPPGGSLARV